MKKNADAAARAIAAIGVPACGSCPHSHVPTFSEAQKRVDNWIKTYGVRYFDPLTNMAQLTEEVGEVARVMSRTYGEQSWKPGDKHKDLADELADVLWVTLCIANQTGIDLDAALERNFDKKTQRDSHRHLHNPKLEGPAGDKA